MEKFRNVLKKRLALMIGFDGFAIILIALTGFYGNMTAGGNENLTDFIEGSQVGIFFALQIMILVSLVSYAKALKSESSLKKLYIKEKDERRKLIQDKIGGVGLNFSFGAIATATVMAGFFHQIVFSTLTGVLIFMALVKGFLKVYYRNKF
ncbi:MAG: rane protein [Clostridia bacterium]|jgi:hypothetical protein|nr:rane protein [Clostridia bacterium]